MWSTHDCPPGGVLDSTVFFRGTWLKMRPQDLRGLDSWWQDGGKWKAQRTARGHMVAAHLPTMLHVLWLVHAYGQFDPQVLVGAGLCHGHLVELWLLGAVGSRMEDDLHGSEPNRDDVRQLHPSCSSKPAPLLLFAASAGNYNLSDCCAESEKWEWGGEGAAGAAAAGWWWCGGGRGGSSASPQRKPNLCALTGEEDCFPASAAAAAALGDQRALSQAKVDATTLSEEGNTHPSITAVSHLQLLLLPRRQSAEDRPHVGPWLWGRGAVAVESRLVQCEHLVLERRFYRYPISWQCPTTYFWYWYRPLSTDIAACGRGINTLWLICIVESCAMSSVSNELFRLPPLKHAHRLLLCFDALWWHHQG